MLVSPLTMRSAGSDESSFVVVEWVDEGGTTSRERPIAPLHVHHADDECWYVLDGKLRFRICDDEVEAGPGDAVFVPAGTPHAYWNAQDGPARYLLVIPRRIADLLHEIHDGNPKDVAAVFGKYESELL